MDDDRGVDGMEERSHDTLRHCFDTISRNRQLNLDGLASPLYR